MATDEKVLELFYAMCSYASSIFINLKELSELEKAGKKNERSYYNALNNLKVLLEQETLLYSKNINTIYKNRGELVYLTTNNGSLEDTSMFDFLSAFDETSIYQRIKTKLKYHTGLKKHFAYDSNSGFKINYYDERNLSSSFLEDTFLTDMQRLSACYMEQNNNLNEKKIDFKYASAMIFNLDKELSDNYFEISNTNIYLNSSLTYALNGRYYEMYIIDMTDVLITKFNEFVDYISLEDEKEEEDKEYKIEIALSYLKSILDLMPAEIKDEFYNDFVIELTDDFNVTNRNKLRIINNLRNANKTRRLINYITVGSADWK